MNWIRYACLAFCVFTLSITGCVVNNRYIALKMVEAGQSVLDAECAISGYQITCLTALGAKK